MKKYTDPSRIAMIPIANIESWTKTKARLKTSRKPRPEDGSGPTWNPLSGVLVRTPGIHYVISQSGK
jgi:hypothetical protein